MNQIRKGKRNSGKSCTKATNLICSAEHSTKLNPSRMRVSLMNDLIPHPFPNQCISNRNVIGLSPTISVSQSLCLSLVMAFFSSSFCFCCCISQIAFSPRRPAAALALISAVTTMSHFNYSTTITTAQWLLSECHSSGLTGIKSYICICHFIRPPPPSVRPLRLSHIHSHFPIRIQVQQLPATIEKL